MIQENVIESDNHWIDSEKCTGFRFSIHYQCKVKPIHIISKKLIKAQLRLSVKRTRVGRLKTDKPTSVEFDKHGFLKKWFDKLELDVKSASELIELSYQEDISNRVESPENKYNAACNSIHRFENGFFHFTTDEQGRFHSNLTNMKSELRNFLTYNGQKLVSLDLKNSQPYLSLTLLNPNFWDTNGCSRGLINIHCLGKNYIQSININSSYSHYTTSLNLVNNLQPVVSQDITMYRDDVLSGRLYQVVKQELQDVVVKFGLEKIKSGNWDVNLLQQVLNDYKALKTCVLTSFYSRNQTINSPQAFVKRAIRKRYPSVYNLFSLIKSKDHTTLPRLLQNIESELLINRVARRINRENRRVPIFTIHDSIVTVVDRENYIRQVLKEEMQKGIGYVGTVQSEYWIYQKVELIS